MKVTVVIENKSFREELLAQYGLSLFIETDNGCILLDAGSNENAFVNFKNLGLSTESIDAIVVSHNHIDHFGGVPVFIKNSDAKVYISQAATNEFYKKTIMHRRTKVSRTDIIDSYHDRFIFVDDQTEVLPGVFVCRINNPCEEFFCKDRSLKRLNKQKLLPDDFSHEIYMAVIEEGDCTIISSCSHNGIINIINDAQRRFPDARVTSFVGGLHMRGRRSDTLNCSKKHAQSVFLMVENYGLKKLYTGHCTGTKAYGLLKMQSRINAYYFSTGDTFIL